MSGARPGPREAPHRGCGQVDYVFDLRNVQRSSRPYLMVDLADPLVDLVMDLMVDLIVDLEIEQNELPDCNIISYDGLN